MTDNRSEPVLRVSSAAPPDVATDLLVVPVFEQDTLADSNLDGLDLATGGEIERARESGEFRPKPNELFLTPFSAGTWAARRVSLVGVGASGEGGLERLRAAAATVAKDARRRRIRRLAVVLRDELASADAVQVVAEGLLLGGFDDHRYRTAGDDDSGVLPPLDSCEIVATSEEGDALEDALRRGVVLATAANLARELSNEPANFLTPAIFADRARAHVADQGITVDVLEEEAIRKLGMGMLLGVARGSIEPPRLVVMRHTPADAPDQPVLGLVGKGVTFDSGGISIKPADGMDLMKRDMSGGAAVVGAMRAIGALKLGVRVIGIVPMVENMPGGRAAKPGDVLTSANGKTVEVLNTDAEGRLILGDALWYAQHLGATHLVDVATLTGSCVVALGKAASGLFGNPTSWVETVQASAARAGERVWPLPLYEEYREQLRSEIADLVNTGGRAGGACTAAAFLGAFAEGTPWAHVDIAGTAWLEEGRPDSTKGATGVMVRTLVELAARSSSW
jgi:leucyl aminopeptidase